MPTLETLLIFAALSLGLAATPGPNMLYLVSRSLAQGVGAGMISLIGCQCGSLLIMLCAAAGITAALFAIPYAWDVLRIGGAAYLAFLAWQCLRPGGQPIFTARPMPREPASRLFGVGFFSRAVPATLDPRPKPCPKFRTFAPSASYGQPFKWSIVDSLPNPIGLRLDKFGNSH